MNIFKRAAITALSLAVVSSSVSGCLFAKKLSMGEMISAAGSFENYGAEVSFNLEGDGNVIDFSTDFQASNKDIALNNLSVKLNTSEDNIEIDPDIDSEEPFTTDSMDLNLGDSIRFIDGNFYLSISSIFEAVKSSADELNNINMGDMGVDWIKIPMDSNSFDNLNKSSKDLSESLSNAFVDVLNSTETKIEEDGDNGYKVTVTDAKQLSEIMNAYIESLEKNKDSYVEDITQCLDMGKITDGMTNVINEVVKALCDKLEITYTEDDLKQIEEQIMASVDKTELEKDQEELKNELKESYDEMIKSLKESQKTLAESKEKIEATYSVSLEGKEGSRTFIQEIALNGNLNNETIKLNYKMKAIENDKTIEAPKDAKSIAECVPSLVDYAVNNGLLSQDLLNMYKGMSLTELLDSSLNSTYEYEQYDIDDTMYDDTDYYDISA
ncbi:MAG: hypothetical protein ACI4I7_05050 [Oscillospiraceae bacterium]